MMEDASVPLFEGPEEEMVGKPLTRNLTTNTLSTSCLSDMESLAISPTASSGARKEVLEETTTSLEDIVSSSPLEKAFRSVGKSVQDWRMKMTQRRQFREAHLLQEAHKETEFANSSEGIQLRQKRLENLGEMGMALFSPIDGAFDSRNEEEHETKDSFARTTTEIPLDGDNEIRIHVIPDDDTIPHLLSESVMKELVKAMPFTLHGRSWKRLYSITRDGDSFEAFLNGIQKNEYTLVVVQTTRGEILGGFADAAWDLGCRTIDGRFFGTGTSFLFSLAQGPIQIFRWKGVNEYSQLCRHGCIGMGGGGGSFGLFLQDDFTRGSSGACDTYGNQSPLASSECFDILNFEVYGFERFW